MKRAMLFVLFFSVIFPASFVSAQGDTIMQPITWEWQLTEHDTLKVMMGGCMTPGPLYFLTHEDHMRVRQIKIYPDHERDDHHPQWVIEFRETQYLDPPQVGHPRREFRRHFHMVGTREKAIVTIDNLPRRVVARKMSRIFLMSMAERLKYYHPPNPAGKDEHGYYAVLHDDILTLLNKVKFEDFVLVK